MNFPNGIVRKRRAFIQASTCWLLLCLAIGGTLIGKGLLLSSPNDHAASAVSPQPAKAVEQWQHEAIADVRVGQRVVTPQTESGVAMETAVDPSTWKLLNLVIDIPAEGGAPADLAEIQTLQPKEWIDENHATPGALVPTPLDLRDMGMEQEAAQVVSIEPCPPIESGPGRVVLTTVNHLNQFLFDLTVVDPSGHQETIGVTGWHKIYSESRGDWVSASTVVSGEALRGKEGVVSVKSLARRPGTFRVYNMTVEDEHVFYVSSVGALVHNNDCAEKVLTSDQLKGFIGEASGYAEALDRGEIGIKAPKHTNLRGPDYVTLRMNPDGTATILVYDAKFASGPKSLSPKKLAAWMDATRNAVDAMPAGPLKNAAQQALKNGRVEGKMYFYTKR